MKKLIILTLFLILILSSCGGNVNHVNVIEVESEMYTQAEIVSAIKVTKEYFRKNFDGCTLTEIGYAGDLSYKECLEWAEQYDADQAIILTSTFEVDSSGGDGSLNSNSTYSDWSWILVRDIGGAWRHATHGYG